MAIGNLAVPFQPAKALYEAENAELLGGAAAAANHRNYTGAGFIDHLDAVGAGVRFKVFASTTGDYTLTTRYANAAGAEWSMTLYVDGRRSARPPSPPRQIGTPGAIIPR